MQYEEVLQFWFEEIKPRSWWNASARLDALIRKRFQALHRQTVQTGLPTWRSSARGRLAEIIVLDQFSRNMYRGTPQAFAHDPMALRLAQEAVSEAAHKILSKPECSFLLMPYMHSECQTIHAQATTLFREFATAGSYRAELKHKNIIARFGRYPHRNKILDRASTADELEFLKQPGSSF